MVRGVELDQAARAFWDAVAEAVPDFRNAIVAGARAQREEDRMKTTTRWGADYLREHRAEFAEQVTHFEYMRVAPSFEPAREIGFRSDGVVVWREVEAKK